MVTNGYAWILTTGHVLYTTIGLQGSDVFLTQWRDGFIDHI